MVIHRLAQSKEDTHEINRARTEKIRTVLGVVDHQIVQGVTQRYSLDRLVEGQK